MLEWHAEDAVNALALFLSDVEHLIAGLYLAGIHAHVAKRAGLAVVLNLEHESEGYAVGLARHVDFLFLLGVETDGGRNLVRSGKIIHDRVDQGLDARVAPGGSADEWGEVARYRRAADFFFYEVCGNVRALENELSDLVGFRGNRVEHFLAPFFGSSPPLVGHRNGLELLAVGFQVPTDLGHVDKIDDALEVGALAHRYLKRNADGAEFFVDVLYRTEIIGADPVHLVDEADARNLVLVRLPPHRLGLGLHAADRAQYRDRAVEHAKRTLYLGRKVHVSGGVDDIDLIIAPVRRRRRALDGDAAFLLLRHPVHRRLAVVDFAYSMDFSRIKKDPLRRRRLSGVDVRHNPDIPHLVQHDKLRNIPVIY